MKSRIVLVLSLSLCCVCSWASVYVQIDNLTNVTRNDQVVLAIQNGKNTNAWHAINSDTAWNNTQSIMVRGKLLIDPPSSVVWKVSKLSPYTFEQNYRYPVQNGAGWSLKQYGAANRFLFQNASTKDTLIWRSSKYGHCVDYFDVDSGDKAIFDQVKTKRTLATGAASFTIFKRQPVAYFHGGLYGEALRGDTMQIADFSDHRIICPTCYAYSSRHPFLGWGLSPDGPVLHQPGDMVTLSDDMHYYAVYELRTVPSQCFDYSNLHSEYVTCRYGTRNSTPDQKFDPADLTEVGVMEGDDLSSMDVHINVITDTNSVCALLDSTVREVPTGFTSSVRLGNYMNNYGCEDVEYTIMVDTIDSPILLLKYLPVLEESHTGGAGIQLQILDEYGQEINPKCASFNFSLEGSEIQGDMPGKPVWKKSPNNPNYSGYSGGLYQYHDWGTIGLDLSDYQGQAVVIKLMTYDCDASGHLGFLYYAFKCQPKKIKMYTCQGEKVRLEAPEGFFYRWHSASNPHLSDKRVVEIPEDNKDSVIYCDLSVKANTEFETCSLTVSVNLSPRYPVADFDYEIRRGYCADTVYINNTSFISPDGVHEFPEHEDCDGALWNFSGGKTPEGANPDVHAYHQVDPIIYDKAGDYTISLKTYVERWECAQDEKQIHFHVSASEEYQVFYDTICLGESFNFMGKPLTPTKAGDQTYVQQVSDVGCLSSVTVEQHLYAHPKYRFVEYDSICPRIPYVWRGKVLRMSGIYYDSLSTVIGGCDSIYELHLYHYPSMPDSTSFRAEICAGEAYWWNGVRYIETGLYTQYFIDQYGCDSIVTLDLWVHTSYDKEILPSTYWEEPYHHSELVEPIGWVDPYLIDSVAGDSAYKTPGSWQDPFMSRQITRDTICEGETYEWRHRTYTATGVYNDTMYTIYGCDSIVQLALWVCPSYDFYEQHIVNKDTGFFWTGHENYPDTLFETGLYYDSLLTTTCGNRGGCDSVYALDLIVISDCEKMIYDTICEGEGLPWHYGAKDTVYYAAGQYTDTLQGTSPICEGDSIIHLFLTVNPLSYGPTLDTIVCQGTIVEWQGKQYNQAGLYQDTLHHQSACQCDSIIYLNLQIALPDTIITHETICEGQTYKWEGREYNSTTQDTVHYFTHYGCDSVRILDLFMHDSVHTYRYQILCGDDSVYFYGQWVKEPGEYTKNLTSLVTFCDSIDHLILERRHDTLQVYDTICRGETLQWKGETIKTAGEYIKTIMLPTGCDSTYVLHLSVARTYLVPWKESQSTYWNNWQKALDNVKQKPSQWGADFVAYLKTDSTYFEDPYWSRFYKLDTICDEGGRYSFGGKILTKPGFYSDTLPSVSGCDSIIYLRLYGKNCNCDTTYSDMDVTFDYQHLQSHPFTWFGKKYQEPGEYADTLWGKNVEHCDSIGTLILRVTYRDSIYACNDEQATFHTPWGDVNTPNDTSIHCIDSCLVALADNSCLVSATLCVTRLVTDTVREDTVLCYGTTIDWHGITVSETKVYDYTEKYLTRLTSCDSVVYFLNATVKPEPVNHLLLDTVCEGTPYTWHTYRDSVITEEGTYYDTLWIDHGCYSDAYELRLTHTHATTGEESATTCVSYVWKGTTYTKSGDYTFDTLNVAGCDSVITLHLTLLPRKDSISERTICIGHTTEWFGRALSEEDVYDTTFYYAGTMCDSLYAELTLHVGDKYRDSVTHFVCQGGSDTWRGKTYTEAGVYRDSAVGVGDDCDSVLTMRLIVRVPTTGEINMTACDTYSWKGTTYTVSGDYIFDSLNVAGCDSTVTLHLTLHYRDSSEIFDTICNNLLPFKWKDKQCTKAGDYVFDTLTTNQCDSVITLHLAVKRCCPDVIVKPTETPSICDSLMPYKWYTWHEVLIEDTALHYDTLRNDLGCDSIIYSIRVDTFHCCPPMRADIYVPDLCADATVLPIELRLQQGEIDNYTVHFHNPALNKYPFRDTTMTVDPLSALGDLIMLDIPAPADPNDSTKYPRPDDEYSVSLILRDICGDSLVWRDSTFTVSYPSWITDQHWDDVIALINDRYNGGYTFSKVEWLRNGIVLPGEEQRHIYLPHELQNDEYDVPHEYMYQARLTRADDGKTILSCPITPRHLDNTNILGDSLAYVHVTPTYVSRANPVVHVMTNTSGTYWLYDVTGKLLRTCDYEPCEHNVFDIELYQVQTMYIIVFTPRNTSKPLRDKYRVVKVLVE